MSLTTLTFGCRLNAAESVVMQARAEAAGLSDAILVNTCAVTAEAVRQARQAIRKARREHPDKRIVVTGCAAQTDPEMFAVMPEVDLVLGNAEKLSPEAWRRFGGAASPPPTRALPPTTPGERQPTIDVVMPGLDPGIHSVTVAHALHGNGMDCRVKPGNDDTGEATVALLAPSRMGHTSPQPFGIAASEKIRVSDIFSVRETAAHILDGFGERHRAFVQIQNGCDHRCTFCIIPFGRGNSRSVPAGAVVEEIRRLAARGFGEVVLTGVDITAWGADLPGRPRLGALVRKILKLVPELPRVRLSSIDSVEADDDLLRALAEEERLMPHLHLSLQSGDDMILKRMKRRHLRADAIRFAESVRKLRPDVVLGADLIAGFPTETDEMFENSVRLIEECGLALLHVFPFSPRNGTPAARMPQLPKEAVRSRAKFLREKGEAALTGFMSGEIGKIRSVLVEKDGFGRSEHYMPVSVSGGEPGKILSARIVGSRANMLAGEKIREAA